jgi:desulfoferrodoxin-like iron-binding protein
VRSEDDRTSDWDLDEWEQALSIQVGTAYVCRACGNVVMVTRGGVGVMELICCGAPMERLVPRKPGEESPD